MHIDRFPRLGVAAFLAAALLSACDAVRPLEDAREGRAACTACHGGGDNGTGAPPVGVNGLATGPGVGAHTVHVNAGVACDSCHVVPTMVGSPGHATGGRGQVTFGGLALGGAPADRAAAGPPQYDPATYSCSAVYCHGGTLEAGGSNTAPSWGQILANCGTCHAFPPPSHAAYTNRLICSGCHSASVESDNATFKAAHLNGTLDVD